LNRRATRGELTEEGSGDLSHRPAKRRAASLFFGLFTQALQFVSSYGEPNLNLFLVQVKSSGPISRTPCACMEHVIIPIFSYSFAQIWTIFALFLIADDVEILAV
jgi:hypothetical protein